MMYSRTLSLIGESNFDKLQNTTIMIIGVGGVGGYVAESLLRCGIKNIIIIDGDKIDITNLNRQVISLSTNIGDMKASICRDRLLSINPDANIMAIDRYYNIETYEYINNISADIVIDCIDDIDAKKHLIKTNYDNNRYVISAMAAGNRYGIPNYTYADIHKTTADPLARIIRKFCRDEGIKHHDCVYTTDIAIPNENVYSISYHTMAMASVISAAVVNKIINNDNN